MRNPRRCFHALLAGALALALSAGVAQAATLYVTPSGSDTWSGALKTPNRARTDGPFATLARARDAVRQAKAAGKLKGPTTVQVAAGTYHLAETLAFGPEDSGTEDAPITYAAAPGAKVFLKGSAPISGWKPWRDGIYRADAGGLDLKAGRFWQLYYREQRQVLARTPNFDPKHPRSGGFLYIPSVVEKESKILLRYRPERLDPTRWSKPSEVRVHVWSWLNWNRNVLPLRTVDPANAVLTLASPASYKLSVGNRFFCENALEELDAPGEWYYDTQTKQVYFLPPDGRNPEGAVSVPVLKTLVQVQGDTKAGTFAQHLRFRGFTLSETLAHLVDLRMAAHCTLTASTLTACGASAYRLGERSHHCRIAGCDIAHVGGCAVQFDDTVDWTHTPEGHLAYNVVDNNHIHHVGEGGDAWGAIRLNPSCGGNCSHHNVISHNLVHDTPRQGISFNGMGNTVEYNHVHHTNQEQSDTGAIGMGSRDVYERGSVIRYNTIHDTGGYNMTRPGVWEYPHYCWGIYLDDYTSGVHVYGNVVVRTYLGGVMVHGGQDNVIENNIIVDGLRQQIQYAPIDSLTSGRTPGHPDTSMWLMTGTKLLRNIFYYTDPKSGWIAGRKWEQVVAQSDYNLLWHAGGPVTLNLPGVEDGDYWAAWRKLGHDTHSVMADPRFVNPKRDDYRLRRDSPAFRLGFKPIPVEKIGLYRSPDRASWPVADDCWREEHIRYPEGEPGAPAARRPAPKLTALRLGTPPKIDGKVDTPEWRWENAAEVADLSMEDGRGKHPGRALVAFDGEALYVALVNRVSDAGALLKVEGTWGADDGAELCLQDVNGAKKGPIFVLQGYPSGKHESVDHAGAPAESVRAAGRAVEYAASIGDGEWIGEWRIPFAALGIDPAKTRTLAFNIGVRKKAENEWIAWASTGGAPWRMESAGELLLEE